MLTDSYLRTVYFALFHSHLSYGLLIWGHSPHCLDILLLQKRALRLMTASDHREHCRPIFARLGILTVYSHYVLLSLLYVKNNLTAFSTRREMHNLSIRGASSINVPYRRLSKTKDCFPVLAMKMFNTLPESVRSLEFGSFKTKLKSWLLSCPLYSLREFFEADTARLT